MHPGLRPTETWSAHAAPNMIYSGPTLGRARFVVVHTCVTTTRLATFGSVWCVTICPGALLPTLPCDLPDSSALMRDRSLGAVSMLPSVTCAMIQ
jgi:hypothetical protein